MNAGSYDKQLRLQLRHERAEQDSRDLRAREEEAKDGYGDRTITEEKVFIPATIEAPYRWVDIEVRDMGNMECHLVIQVRRWDPRFWWDVVRAIWTGRQ